MPRNITVFRLFFTVDNYLHPKPIKAVDFIQIKNVKFYFIILKSVLNFEEKPLGISICVDIVLEK